MQLIELNTGIKVIQQLKQLLFTLKMINFYHKRHIIYLAYFLYNNYIWNRTGCLHYFVYPKFNMLGIDMAIFRDRQTDIYAY